MKGCYMNPGEQIDGAASAIEAIRKELGKQLLILGHYYQRDEVLRHADVVGDSLELSRRAAESSAERIVFCGVHFMAESADILTGDNQTVYMPDVNAGCPMADMAPLRQVEKAWADLQARGGGWLPVVYVNSRASVKAFCGMHGGSTCTSSNAAKVFQWVFAQDKRVLFIPDEHLGTNTAHDLGLPDDAVAVYDPDSPGRSAPTEPGSEQGGLTADAIARTRVLVWPGYCHVHMFRIVDIEAARNQYPGAKVIVHPETPKAVTRLADAHGSTSQIIRYVDSQPEGSTIVVGTELHLVERMARQHQGRRVIVPLRPSVCRNMALTNEAKLLLLLEGWLAENEVRVAPELKHPARQALERMLAV
ncbi:MAG: quinolinate synthase NadA [Verrucomicrobia bacterium]|nr:quinolinate synthase NadA [Verrucomicrobiota bacterium]MBU4247012.1 quinolinate synthase NadA [Verrucomicrobiota bacterium]MBU4290338.1 quinolinate synthase NadA [Verrucomicrobiota bacterium]MBU4429131.1 quinolinate synthase NadA [Verrucomicrobiota bacterium]MCG2681763.1 quinolinate synthase NadA [Kiritimatiellia bacterium]